jgi:hypothetical protein
MKTVIFSLSVFFVLIFAGVLQAQTLSPKVVFKDDLQTHNMHLASDGFYYYTCNGGKAELGQISKFSLDGIKVASYKIKLDMRSIMFNTWDNKFYVYTYTKKFYRIDDLERGKYAEIYDFSDRDEQSVPALSANGRQIYFMESGDVFKYKFRNRKLFSTLSGLKTGENHESGSTVVAVDKKHIYCWDAAEQMVFIYDQEGKFEKSVKLSKGNYGFSLSYANGMVWVSDDGNYEEGTWYGYMVE